MKRGWRIAPVIAVLAMLVAGVLVVNSAQAEDERVGLPGGMANFSVAVGKVDAASRANWQRLGTYVFKADGTVSERHWHWTQRRREVRSYTGVQASGCPSRDCDIQTAHGFQSKSAPQQLAGKFAVSGDVVKVTWSDGLWEEWTISQPMERKLAKLSFKASSFGASHGFGYGSNAGLDKRASMKDVAAVDHGKLRHEYYLWKTDANNKPYVDSGAGAPFWMQDWSLCGGGKCLGGETSKPTEYYLSAPNASVVDRRDTIWHWVRQLADDRDEYCYTGNSHVKPMLQIIDSDGGFHGWVGAEASLSQTSPGTNADDVGLFEISEFSKSA